MSSRAVEVIDEELELVGVGVNVLWVELIGSVEVEVA